MPDQQDKLEFILDLKYAEFIEGSKQSMKAFGGLKKDGDKFEGTIKSLNKQIAVAKVRMQSGDKAATQFALALELGSKASDAQRAEVSRLTGELYELERANRVAGRSGIDISNIGYQIQDAMVQAQAGTSGFIIAAQQVPQALSGMGPLAATIGTAIAAVSIALGVLMPDLVDATSGAEKFEAAMEKVNETLEVTEGGVVIVSDKIRKLAEVSEEAARIQLSLGLVEAKRALDAAKESITEATEAYDDWVVSLQGETIDNAVASIDLLDETIKRTGLSTTELLENTDLYGTGLGQLKGFVEQVGDELGITTVQSVGFIRAVKDFQATKSPESMQALASTVNALAVSMERPSEELLTLASNLNNAALNATKGAETISLLETMLDNFTETISEANTESREFATSLDSMIESLEVEAATLGKTDRQRAVYIATLKGANEAEIESINLAYDRIEAYNAEAEAQAELLKRFQEGQETDLKVDKQQEKGERFLESLLEQQATELELISIHEQAKLDRVKEFEEQLIFNEEEAEQARTLIAAQAADARMKLAEMESKSRINVAKGMFGDLATLMNSGSRKAFEIGKTAAIARAVISGGEAAVAAWNAGMSTGGPWAPAVAAAYTAASLAKTGVQISNLKSQQFSRGGSQPAGGGGATPTAPATPAAPVQPEQQAQRLDINITGSGSDKLKDFIFESINDGQNEGLQIARV
jgi:hypothetical protein